MNLLLASSYAWIPDVVFCAVLLIGFIIGVIRGFVKGICKLAGTIFSIVCAIFFCMPLHTSLEEWFGFTTLIANGIGNATVAEWLSIAVSFVGLIIVVRLLALIVGLIAKALIKASKVLNVIDHIMGGLLGAAEALIILLIVLMLCYWMNIEVINTFISETTIVGAIYNSSWFMEVTNLPGRIIQDIGAVSVMLAK